MVAAQNRKFDRSRSLMLVALAYITSVVPALFWAGSLDLSPLWAMAVFDLIATALIFAWSYSVRNSSIYDPYWSVIPIVIGGFWMVTLEGNDLRKYLIIALISLWGIRLTFNWIKGWSGLEQEDWRYRDLKAKLGRWYWPVSFLGIHLLPTILVFTGSLPVYYAMETSGSVGLIDAIALVIGLTAVVIEWRADEQLRQFRRSRGNQGRTLQNGLWRYMRHPNYFGEILFWTSLFLFIPASGSSAWWTLVGMVAMLLLFLVVSIPMMEKRLMSSRSDYGEYRKRVPPLFPISFKLKMK